MSTATLRFIGTITTPYPQPADCPRQPWSRDEVSTITVHPGYTATLTGLEPGTRAHVLWWAHTATRDTPQRPQHPDGPALGVLAGRGVDRPNPIGLTVVELLAIDGAHLAVRGMDCVTGSPLLDIKPAIDLPGYQ